MWLFKRKRKIKSKDKEVKNCSTCRFNSEDEFICFVDTYYATKGQKKLCYEGELWENKNSN